jgi:outer membrane murein-binding lipoprotein Lpp
MEQTTDIAQLEAKIEQLAEEKRAAHEAVASCEYQLDTKGRTFTFHTATEEERTWFGKTRYALRKHKQKANDLQLQIGKLNATLKEKKKMAKKVENMAEQESKYLAFYRNARKALPPAVFEAILEQTIQQVGAL